MKVGEIYEYETYGRAYGNYALKILLRKAKKLGGDTVYVYDEGIVEEILVNPCCAGIVVEPVKAEVYLCD